MITRGNLETLLGALLSKRGINLDELVYKSFSMNVDEFLQLCEREYEENIKNVNMMFSKEINNELEQIIFEMEDNNNVELYKYIINYYMEKIELISNEYSIRKNVIKGIIKAFDNVTIRISDDELTVFEIYEEYPGLIRAYELIIDEILNLVKSCLERFIMDHKEISEKYGIYGEIIDLSILDLHTVLISTSEGKIEYSNYIDELEISYYSFVKELNKSIGKPNYIYEGKYLVIKNGYVWSNYEEVLELGDEETSKYVEIGRIICIMYSMNYLSDNSKDDIVCLNGRPQISDTNRLFLNTFSDDMNPVNDYIKKSVDSFNIYKRIQNDKVHYVAYGFEEMYDWIKKNKEVVYNLLDKHFCNYKKGKRVCINNIINTSVHPYFLESDYIRKLYIMASILNYKIDIENVCKNIIIVDYKNNYISEEDNENCENYLEKVKEKVEKFGKIDLNKQRSIMLAKMKYVSRLTLGQKSFDKNTTYDNIKSKEIVCNILNRISDKSILDMEGCTSWIHTMGGGDFIAKTEEVDIGLYNGISGIMITFYYASKLYNVEKYLEVAKKIGKKVYNMVDVLSNFEHQMHGAFTGVASGVYALLHCRDIIEYDMEKLLYKYLLSLEKNYNTLDSGDYIYGLSGVLCVLDLILNSDFNEELNNLCKKLIKNIVDKIIKDMKYETKFRINTWEEKGYTGYAHGSSGVSAQLARVNKYIEDDRILDVVNSTIKYENMLYSINENNWFRDSSQEYCNCGWCHGAPGILLNRIMLSKAGFKNTFIEKDIYRASKKIMSYDIGRDVCLCHGDLGNLIILKEASDYLKDEEINKYVEDTYKNKIFVSIIDDVSCGGIIDRFEDCGLMCGLSSIAYGIMKLENNNVLPNILCLE